MGDQDWLETGHGGGEGLSPMIKGSSSPAVDRVSIRSVLRGTEAAKPRASRRRNKVLVGWLLYCATAVGGTAAAFTVRDALFPSLGAPTDPRVWPNPTTADSTLVTEHGSSTIAEQVTTVTPPALVVATAAPTAQSVDAATVPTVANSSQGPGNSIDNSGPGNGGAPAPGTTVDVNPSSGPGPGTTVDGHPTDTSTPSSASGPPSSADATPTTPTTPGDGTSPNKGSGKGGGGGGGGGDSGGGDRNDPPAP